MNNNLLKYENCNNIVKYLITELFSDLGEGCKQKWEFFKHKTRYIAIKGCTIIKTTINQLETVP